MFVFLIKIFGIIILLVIIAVIIFALALINASKKHKSDQSLENNLREIISRARRIKFKAEADISRMRMWANDAIALTYGAFINDYPADELIDFYEEIKQNYANQIDPAQVEKTDNIVKGYIGQIKIKQIEKQAAEKTLEKYNNLLNQLKQAKQKEHISKRLERHEQKLEQLSADTSAQKQLIEHNLSYDMFRQDVEQKIAYLEALQQLQEKFDTHTFVQNADVYKQELDKIINNLEPQNAEALP